MKCKKCGVNNPINVNKCIYCGASLSHSTKSKAKRKSKNNQRNQTDNIIIGIIIALVAVLVVLGGIYAFNYMPKKGGFSSGGGGGVILNQQPQSNNSDVPVTIDGDDPDVEIYSFNTDTYDILVGETKRVTFTSEIFANIKLNDNDVSVVTDSGESLGYMNDKGVEGDSVANDGIYTLQKDMTYNNVKNILCYAKVKNVQSTSINLCFYKNFTDEDINEYEQTVAALNEVTEPYIDENGYLLDGKNTEAKNALVKKLKQLKSTGVISQYKINDTTISIQLSNGIPFVYELMIQGTDSVLGGGRISTYQPFKNTYSFFSGLNEQSDDATDGSAKRISNKFDTYSFGSNYNYDLDDVTLENLKSINHSSVVIWHGHGGYNLYSNEGASLAIGEEQNKTTTKNYSADITSFRIIQCSAARRKVYAITGGFVDKYVGNMNGAMLYLAACESGKDMSGGIHRYRLADSFINKGAVAVVANTETICTNYNTRMERDVCKRMLEYNENYKYYNLEEALSRAKKQNGNFCCNTHKSETKIFPHNRTDAREYRLKEAYGQAAGSIRSAETNVPLKNVLVRAYKDNQVVNKIRTDADGYYNMKLPAGDYILKITKGTYKSAKIAVTVSENSTIYNETLLLLDAGITTGYANGTITDAVSGQGVDNVSLKMRFSWNNKDGMVLHTTSTNENGYYEISFAPGFYTIEYSKDGYITGYKNIIIGIVDYESQNAVISPEMPDDGNFRIVLSWSNKPKDLDSHLTGPMINGERFHLYYKYANTNNRNTNSAYYQLDLDNTDIILRPNIPETTTIVTQLDGVYRYSIHDYTNRGNGDSDAMSQSNATVNVYKGSVLIATYHVPSNVNGSIWTVFELSGNEIKPINKIGNGLEDDVSNF